MRTPVRVFATCLVVLAAVAQPAASQPAGDVRLESIRSRLVEGSYAVAETDAERLVAALDTPDARESGAAGAALDLLVEALVRNGKGADSRTLKLAEQSIAQREAHAGLGDSDFADSLRNLGDVLVEAGDYQRARDPYDRSLTVTERQAGRDADAADLLDRLANLFVLTEKYDDALKASDRALALRSGSSDRDDAGMARTLEVRGLLLQRRGEYAHARTVIEQALAIRDPRPIHPDLAETLSLLAEQRRFEGDISEARRYAARSVAVAEQTLRPDHPNLAAYLRILAISTGDLGDLAGARALRERAVAIVEGSLPPDHVAVALQLNDLAASHVRGGDYAAARALYARALKTYEQRLEPDHSGVITEVYNLAVVNARLGDFVEARRQFDRAITTWERVVGPTHPFVALALSALAEMLANQGRYREAITTYQRALSLREGSLGRNHRDVAQTMTLLAVSLARAGQISRAYELSVQALAIWDQLPEHDSQRVADALQRHGSIQAQRGELSGAQAAFERSVAILQRIVGPSHPQVAEVRALRAGTLAKTGQLTQALDDALGAEEIGRDHLRFMLRYLPERQGIDYAAQRPKGLDLSLSLMAPQADGSDIDRVFDGLIRSRGLLLDEMAWRRHLSTDATRPDLAPLWSNLVSARQRFANLFIRGVSQQDAEGSKALIDDAQRQKEEAERAFASRSATFRDELARVETGLSDVRAALPRDSALVAFVRYDRTPIDRNPAPAATVATRTVTPATLVSSYAAFVLTGNQPHVGIVLLGSSRSIEALVARWQTEIMRAARGSSPTETEQAYRTAGTALRQRVWDPLRKYLTGAATVFIVPDGALNVVSFAALPVGQTNYLAEQGPLIHFLSVERDLLSTQSPVTTGKGMLAVGGAAFDDATLFANSSKPVGPPSRVPPRPAPAATQLQASCGTLQSIQFSPLAGTAKEAHDIASFWRDSESTVLEGRAASERSFKRDASGRQVLHLATHGFFLADDCSSSAGNTRSVGGLVPAPSKPTVTAPPAGPIGNPLLRSGLALAGANRRANAGPDEDDGILTAEEVSALNLGGVEWAVLSACETALGEIRSGEGVFGLRRAFQVAGARTIIMSLWAVDDIATQAWMRTLYQNRLQQGLTTAESIRAASVTVLRDRRARQQSTHPFYWAAFVAAGNWR